MVKSLVMNVAEAVVKNVSGVMDMGMKDVCHAQVTGTKNVHGAMEVGGINAIIVTGRDKTVMAKIAIGAVDVAIKNVVHATDMAMKSVDCVTDMVPRIVPSAMGLVVRIAMNVTALALLNVKDVMVMDY